MNTFTSCASLGSVPPRMMFKSSSDTPRLPITNRITSLNVVGRLSRSSISSLTNLTELDLHSTDIEGPVPEAIGALTNLQSLDLSYMGQLSGSLPDSLSQLTALQSL